MMTWNMTLWVWSRKQKNRNIILYPRDGRVVAVVVEQIPGLGWRYNPTILPPKAFLIISSHQTQSHRIFFITRKIGFVLYIYNIWTVFFFHTFWHSFSFSLLPLFSRARFVFFSNIFSPYLCNCRFNNFVRLFPLQYLFFLLRSCLGDLKSLPLFLYILWIMKKTNSNSLWSTYNFSNI